ncbi:MAG TPA: hypothetical protein VNN08_17410 [Thermoanaerobaculia bacterium]|nr:hypothetical protein [Thermoanaerobaculia bacterium]
MNQDDICLRLNRREISQYRAWGETLDVSFFEHNRRYFNGRHRFGFCIGDIFVLNDVSMRPFDIHVRNEFIPIDIRALVEAEKLRVGDEKRQAGFEDRPKDIYYLESDFILSCEELPEFNESNLSKDPDGNKFFVSHRWNAPSHPDPDRTQLALLKEHARKHTGSYYWVDYSCLPQPRLTSDTKLFDKTLPKLTSIQSDTSTIVIMDELYGERLWCYVEHYIGVLFSQTNFGGKNRRGMHYLGSMTFEERRLAEDVQSLREPEWDKLLVTKATDIPFIKLNYRFLTNIVKFQLLDRFAELYNSLPGIEIYSPVNYLQTVFGLSYSESLERIRAVYRLFGWQAANLYEKNSLVTTAALLARSEELDAFPIDDLRFSKYLFHSEEKVAYLAMLVAVIRQANRFQKKIKQLRTLYAKLVIMSLFR